ncbi:hypothetical protein [Streptomyces axinellae]|uniref:Uncharacterized protein n=1 Tax=Streptomyces axinellae TaxID=552788 RepID=A0ABN3R0S2_9ACTN
MSSGDAAEEPLRLDLAAADGPGKDSETLASSGGDKKRAARFMEDHLLPDVHAAGRMGEGGGKVVPPLLGPGAPGVSALKPDTGLQGLARWATASGLSEAMPVWEGQVGRLMARLHAELKALGGAKNLLQDRDITHGQDLAATPQTDLSDAAQPPSRSRLDHF